MNDEKICPLLLVGWYAAPADYGGPGMYRDGNCGREQCAWWDSLMCACVVHALLSVVKDLVRQECDDT